MTEISDLQLLTKALSFAAHKHRYQKRKDLDASPYINHPIALTGVLVNEGGITDTEILCAALLHDTVEGYRYNRSRACGGIWRSYSGHRDGGHGRQVATEA